MQTIRTGEDEVVPVRHYGTEDTAANAKALAEEHLIERLRSLFA